MTAAGRPAAERRNDLLARIRAHRPAGDGEVEAIDAVIRLLEQHPGDPLSRDTFDPGHVTASGFVLSPDRERLLLVLHRRLGIWVQPGGHVDATDRDIAAAARREVVEETGLTDLEQLGAIVDVDVHPIPPGRGEPEHLHHDVRFLFVAATDHLEPSDEVADVSWVPLDRVETVATDVAVVRAADAIRVLVASGSGP